MAASINSFNAFTLHSGISQTKPSEIHSPSNKTKDENSFVKKVEKSSSNLNFDVSYKLEPSLDKLRGTFSMLNKKAAFGKKSDEQDLTFREINTEKQTEEMASRSWNEINETTLKSAVKLYSILKGDILLENFFDFKTGSVDFFA